MPEHGSPTVRRRRLAAELRRLRERSGLTGDDVASELGWSASKISRYELARTGLKPADVKKMLHLYEVDEASQLELIELAREATRKGWWEDYGDALPGQYADLIGLEDEARSCRIWQIECVPGLLQIRDYARQVNVPAQDVARVPPGARERLVEVRMRRQQILDRDPPAELDVILDESALLRQLAEPGVMRAQLEFLAERTRLPNVTIRVVPLAGQPRGVESSFVVLSFGRSAPAALNDVVSIENFENTLYFEGEMQTYHYRLMFDLLAGSALDPADSLRLIEQAGRRWA